MDAITTADNSKQIFSIVVQIHTQLFYVLFRRKTKSARIHLLDAKKKIEAQKSLRFRLNG